MIERLRSRTELLLKLFVVAAPLTVLLDVLVGARVLFNKDIQLSFYPMKTYLREQLLSGSLPLWTPELGLGMPFLALPETGTLYPGNLLLLLPWPGCIGQMLAAHVALASFGMYLLARHLRIQTSGAVFAALCYSTGGYLLSMVSSSGMYAMAMAWAPVVVYLARRVAADGEIRWVALFGLASAAAILTGDFQGCLFIAYIGVFLALSVRKGWRTLIRLAAGALVAVLVALPQIVSTGMFLFNSRRGTGLSLAEATGLSLHPLRLIETFVAGFLGDVWNRNQYLGFHMNRVGKEWLASPWSDSVYLGSIAVVFVIFAVIRLRKKRTSWQAMMLFCAIFATFGALGDWTPLFPIYYLVFPLTRLFRYPEKLFFITSFAVALLAGYGVSDWVSSRRSSARVTTLGVTFGVVAALIFGVLLLSGVLADHFHALQSWVTAEDALATIQFGCLLELSLLLGSALVLYLVSKRRPEWRGPAAVLCLFVQLAFFGSRLVQTTSPEMYDVENTVAPVLVENTPAERPTRLLNSPFTPVAHAPCLTNGTNAEIAKWKHATLTLNAGLMYGVGQYHTYTGMKTERAKRFWKKTKPYHREMMDLLTIPFGLYPLDHAALKDPSMQRIGESDYPCLGLMRSDHTLPLVRLVGGAFPAESLDDVLLKIHDSSVMSGGVAIIEGIDAPFGTTRRNTDKCDDTHLSGDGLTAECVVSAPTWVVANIAHAPSLVARVDGNKADMKRANGLVTAVKMDKGSHSLTITHEEPFLLPTLIVSLLSLVACVAVALFSGRRKSR